MIDTLNELSIYYDIPIIFSTHPRTLKMINKMKIELNKNIRLIKPLGFVDYIKLQQKSKTVLSDSGTISEEASILGLNALNIREAHERPEAMEEGTVILTGLGKERVLQSLEIVNSSYVRKPNIVKDYNMNNVSDKVLKIIISYTNYVNNFV